MTPADVARYYWLCSQRDWHSAKRGSGLGYSRWHTSQAAWYRKQICALPGLFTWIVSETFRKNAGLVAKNVTQNNALLTRMKREAHST